MSKKKTKTKSSTTPKLKKPNLKLSSQQKFIFGSLLIILGILLCISFLSFFFTGKADQSTLTELTTRTVKAENWLNKLGAWVSDLFITRGFGIASFIFSGLLFISGIYITLDINKARLRKHWIWGILIIIWLSIFFGFFAHKYDALSGTIGFEMNTFFQDYIGIICTSLLLLFGLITYMAIRFGVTGHTFVNLFSKAKKDIKDDFASDSDSGYAPLDNDLTAEAEDIKSAFDLSATEVVEPTIKNYSTPKVASNEVKIDHAIKFARWRDKRGKKIFVLE